MLSLLSSQSEPSALLSNARSTIATLIQRPSTITTSNAFDEFSILDHLIDVSNDVDRFEDGESRKFLNIAQLISASTCIYSRRVDALYKLINTFQSSDTSPSKDNEQPESTVTDRCEETPIQKVVREKKRKSKTNNRSFISHDLSKINLNPSKTNVCNRTSSLNLTLFQKYVPFGNKQFWTTDYRPIIFNLLFDDEPIEIKQEPEQIIDVLETLSPIPAMATFDDNDIDFPSLADDDRQSFRDTRPIVAQKNIVENRRSNKTRRKTVKQDLDLNVFRNGLTDEQQEHFRFLRVKPISNKIKAERTHFFIKRFSRNHFDQLIRDFPTSLLSILIYPTITVHHLSIRERYLAKTDRSSDKLNYLSVTPSYDIHDDYTLNIIEPPLMPNLINAISDDIQDDSDIRLQNDMEQLINAAADQDDEEQEHNKIFLELRSSISSYMKEHEAVEKVDAYDLFESLQDHYSLPLVFSQMLHLCATTQRYFLHSTSDDTLFIDKLA